MDVTIDGVSLESLGNIPKNSDKSFQYLLIRTLIGTVKLRRNSIQASQDTDYSSLPPVPQAESPRRAFDLFLKAYGINGSTKRFISATSSDNRSFFRDLLGEYTNYFIQTKKENHTAAFIFLYRILERLSYSTPLLYCSTKSDYIGTFNDLKALFDSQATGELGLFRKFINQGKFIENVKLDITYTIDFCSANGYQSKYFDLVTKHYTDFPLQDKAISQVSIEFRKVSSLIIQLRNRFFHSKTGEQKENIRIEEVIDSDEFFSCLNKTFCSFLSIVTLQTIAKTYSN